jgi:hypothetical protein
MYTISNPNYLHSTMLTNLTVTVCASITPPSQRGSTTNNQLKSLHNDFHRLIIHISGSERIKLYLMIYETQNCYAWHFEFFQRFTISNAFFWHTISNAKKSKVSNKMIWKHVECFYVWTHFLMFEDFEGYLFHSKSLGPQPTSGETQVKFIYAPHGSMF